MAPALTEPLSPTENLNNSAVTATTTIRSGRKLEIVNNKSETSSIKPASSNREKRNRIGGTTTNQSPTTSKRLTRFRESIQRKTLTPPTLANCSQTEEITSSKRTTKVTDVQESDNCVSNSINKNSSFTKNEQMGLSAVPLINKNKGFNSNNKNTNQSLDTVDDATKDTSTAQLLADLTNEALTAEICLRNQLKDVNLVKTPSSPIIPQESFIDTDSDIVLLKSDSPTIVIESDINKKTTAHMEAQLNKTKSSSFLDTTSHKEIAATTSTETLDIILPEESTEGVNQRKEIAVKEKCHCDDNGHKKENPVERIITENYMENAPVESPQPLDDATEAKKTLSKADILSLQELPPVSTDSTMTASEVEDNLEERLSQLDGTAIDSPPPTNHDINSNQKISPNSDADATPPHTPIHQPNLCNDLQALQQQIKQTSPTPVSQQEESGHLQLQQSQPQQQPQPLHSFNSPQSTSSSVNLLSNTSTNVSHTYIKESDSVGGGNAGELEDQDIEEVFKVLKGFEGGTTSDLNVCDLNVLFNEVYMKINETELSGNAVSSGSISSNTQNHATLVNPSIQLVKPTEMEEGQMEIEKRQQQMQRKIDFLLRRLRKLQARYMCKHTSEEIAGLFEWSARQASKGGANASCLQHIDSSGAQEPNKCYLKVISARPPASDWKDLNETLVPANQISTLLRRIESVANAQQLCTTPAASLVNVTNKKSKKALIDAQTAVAAGNTTTMGGSLFNESKAEEVVVATLEENITDELSQIAGLLQIEMSEVQKAIDSDATESSSGGESADEMVTYNNTQQQTLPITKRAAWRYSRDRAAIASRWSWLLSQISDLEIKIRQHSELYQEVVKSKGSVTCEGQKESRNSDDEELMGSCRTRGFIPSSFRKRKLIQTTNIHTISKKAARPSTIKCGCQWPLHPCALCTGRSDPTAPRDLPDTMMMSDRIALLDSGYHPVLSFRENVNNALHFEAIAKQPEWQQRVMRCQAKSIAKNVWRAEREAVAAAAGGHHNSSSKKYSEAPPTKRRYIKKKDRFNNKEKSVGKSSNSTLITQQQHAVASAAQASIAPSLTPAASLNDVGNGTTTLSTTSSTTPLVANKGMVRGAKKQNCPVAGEEILKEPSNSLPPPKCLNTTSFTSVTTSAGTTTVTCNRKYIHQTSDCLPINYDQYNPNQIHSSLISNNNNHNISKSNKHRKLSSSTAVNSHHYNHPNNSSSNLLYNGDSSYMLSQDYWGGAGENLNVRSRTSSPIYGSSGNVYHKYERSLDRKNRTSYDIDNIVIPYSVAAATRVEVLPYKEIPTPKWRVIDNENDQNEASDAKTTNDFESDLEALLDATNVTNGHVSESENRDLIEDFAKKLKENTTSVNVDNSKENRKSQLKMQNNEETKANENCLAAVSAAKTEKIEEKINKIQNHYQEIKNECKNELEKLKVDAHILDSVNCKPEHDGAEKDFGEEVLTLQNYSKSSIEEDEDISDDAMFLRHERALTEERRKFQTYLKFPWSTRSRANRRIDSRAESSGANTPDPSSPAPQTPSVGGGDLESIPSPLNPATPLNPLDIISEAGDVSTSFLGINSIPSLSSKHYERRRTTSTKRDRELERRSSTPDSKELIPPYEPLTFPLTDEQFEELLRAMPSDHGEDCKRFDDCYLPSGNGGAPANKYPRTLSGSTSKRSSRASTLCGETIAMTTGGVRRTKSSSSKNLIPISADDRNADDMLLFDDDYEDDYPKHHLAPNDDHLTADSAGVGKFTASDGLYVDDDDDVYGDQYGAYVGRHKRKHRDDIEEDSSEEEPFQDDDPNDPEWRGETEERFRKKV